MAYNEFAYFYDEFNDDADYTALFTAVTGRLRAHGVADGIVVDLGCGTGDLTLMLAQAGYDMIGVDQSEEMLAVLREKAAELGVEGLLLLRQDLLELDLYGTIRAAVSTFDTFNHIGPLPRLEQAIARAALFMEKDGVFIFDMNTPYKHTHILADNTFTLEAEDALCVWQNHLEPENQRTRISIRITYPDSGEACDEEFYEYWYTLEQVRAICEAHGLSVVDVRDGESFGACTDTSQRWLITAIKQYTQEERETTCPI